MSADEEITKLESEYSRLLDTLRACDKDEEIRDPLAPEFIAHLSSRTKHLRDSFIEMSDSFLGRLFEYLEDFENIKKMTMALMKTESQVFRDRFEKEIKGLHLSKHQKRQAWLHLKSLVPTMMESNKAEYEAFFQETGAKMRQIIPGVAKDGHIQVLAKALVAEPRAESYRQLHLSFLARDAARELIEHPVPEFALGYAEGVVERILELTHCQPYLLQAVGSELVNYINSQKRKVATPSDLDVAVERVLVSADAYFENNWRDCSESEQAVLRGLATGEADELTAAERPAALQGLSRKELVEQRGERWQYTIELFRRWVLKNRVPAAVSSMASGQAVRIA